MHCHVIILGTAGATYILSKRGDKIKKKNMNKRENKKRIEYMPCLPSGDVAYT